MFASPASYLVSVSGARRSWDSKLSDVDVRQYKSVPNRALLTKAVETASAPAVIAAAYAEASRRCETAKTALRALPPTPARDSLEALLDYVVRRRS